MTPDPNDRFWHYFIAFLWMFLAVQLLAVWALILWWVG